MATATATINGTSMKKSNKDNSVFNRNEKQHDVRQQNIIAAKGVADAIRTSLGPKGMDKMIQDAKGGVVVTNDGATILSQMNVSHPAARMLVDLSKAQDVEAGDGTTSVVIICGALLSASQTLLEKGVHPQVIADGFLTAAKKAESILQDMAVPVDLSNRETLIKSAATSLSSKVVSQSASLLAPMAVDAVLKVIDPHSATNVNLSDIHIVKKLGGTVDDSMSVEGLVFSDQKVVRKVSDALTRVQNAKIGLIQFCLAPPKTDMENSITVKDYQSMDRLLREERIIIAKMVKQIASTGCNVLLIQKSILHDAVTELSLDYLAKGKILVIKDIERDDVDFISRTCGCEPVASIDQFTSSKLGHAELVSEEDVGGGGRIVSVTGVQTKGTVTLLLRASNSLVLEESERSLHDALCVVRSLVKHKALLPGGGAPEMELTQKLHEWARNLKGEQQICVKAFADALEVIPYTLAENAGLRSLEVVTDMRKMHALGDKYAGINVRKGAVTNMLEENVVQPLLVTRSSIKLATEAVMMILKIDDIVASR